MKDLEFFLRMASLGTFQHLQAQNCMAMVWWSLVNKELWLQHSWWSEHTQYFAVAGMWGLCTGLEIRQVGSWYFFDPFGRITLDFTLHSYEWVVNLDNWISNFLTMIHLKKKKNHNSENNTHTHTHETKSFLRQYLSLLSVQHSIIYFFLYLY